MKKNFSRFTVGIAAALLVGAGILGALLPGCFNPLAAGSPGVEKIPGRTGGLADAWIEPESFDVEIQITQATPAAPNTSLGSRAIAGPGALQLAMRGTDSIRNFAQLIVLDLDDPNRKIVYAGQKRRENDNEPGTVFTVDTISGGRNYAFLLLMGHWERDSTNTGYLPKAPTLLAAGLREQELQLLAGEDKVIIAVFPVQVDTQFAPLLANDNPAGTATAAPLITADYQPQAALLYEAAAQWRFDWTVKGRGAYNALKLAQDLAQGTQSGPGLNFSGSKTGVAKAFQSSTGDPPQPPAYEDPETTGGGSLSLTWNDAAAGWLSSDGISSVNAGIGSVTAWKTSGPAPTPPPYAGWGYFNLEYVPLNITDPAAWDGFKSDGLPEFYPGGTNTPRWIIRNGINDEAQDKGTYFSPWKRWNGRAYGTLKFNSGNGSLITVEAGGQLILTGSLTTRVEAGKQIVTEDFIFQGGNSNASLVEVKGDGGNPGYLILAEGAAITGHTHTEYKHAKGGGVHMDANGHFIMIDGKISGNTVNGIGGLISSRGGGVFVGADGHFIMIDGEISGNGARLGDPGLGGGVFVDERGYFAMINGEISGNWAGDVGEFYFGYGGGVAVHRDGTFKKYVRGDDYFDSLDVPPFIISDLKKGLKAQGGIIYGKGSPPEKVPNRMNWVDAKIEPRIVDNAILYDITGYDYNTIDNYYLYIDDTLDEDDPFPVQP